MFLIFNQLEQLEFKLEKNSGFRNMQEKLENDTVFIAHIYCAKTLQKGVITAT